MTVKTAPEDDPDAGKKRRNAALVAHQYRKGQTGNPAGKPAGARNRLTGHFVRRLADDFERYGIYAIARVRRSDPSTYLRVVASLLPKEVEIKKPLDDISDEQLDAAYAAVAAILAAQDPGSGEGEAGVIQPTQGLPAVPEAG